MAVNILMVEDDPEQAALFAQVLAMPGYTVEIATDAVQARAQLTSRPFELLLADWDLPGEMKGDDLIRWAKRHIPGIKTILFSNHPQVGEYADVCQADGWLSKIDVVAELRRKVKELAP